MAKEVGVGSRLTPSSACDTSTHTLSNTHTQIFNKRPMYDHLNLLMVYVCICM